MYTKKQIFDRIISILLPKRCVLCGDAVEFDDLYCGKCEIPYAHEIANSHGIMIPKGSGLEGATSPIYYTGNARTAVLRLKREPDERTAHFFAESMHKRVKADFYENFDLIVPIPISREKLSKRGFNQAETLAFELCGLMGKKLECGVLLRNDFTEPQHKLTARERMENAEKSYSAQNIQRVKGLKILLVDDVYTTGATVGACALLLKGAGAASVSAITATYTKAANRHGDT